MTSSPPTLFRQYIQHAIEALLSNNELMGKFSSELSQKNPRDTYILKSWRALNILSILGIPPLLKVPHIMSKKEIQEIFSLLENEIFLTRACIRYYEQFKKLGYTPKQTPSLKEIIDDYNLFLSSGEPWGSLEPQKNYNQLLAASMVMFAREKRENIKQELHPSDLLTYCLTSLTIPTTPFFLQKIKPSFIIRVLSRQNEKAIDETRRCVEPEFTAVLAFNASLLYQCARSTSLVHPDILNTLRFVSSQGWRDPSTLPDFSPSSPQVINFDFNKRQRIQP